MVLLNGYISGTMILTTVHIHVQYTELCLPLVGRPRKHSRKIGIPHSPGESGRKSAEYASSTPKIPKTPRTCRGYAPFSFS